MAEVSVMYFETPGPGNTDETLRAAAVRAERLGIRQLVVATSSGQTALRAAQIMSDMDTIVGVTLHAGRWALYERPNGGTVAKAEVMGVRFLTCGHALMGSVATAIRQDFGGLPPEELIARTYYTICQGTKVAVECAIMAADAGLLDMNQDVISIAGTGKGADTALVIRPAFSNEFFKLRVREFVAMPRSDQES